MSANNPKPFNTFEAAMRELARRREAEARKAAVADIGHAKDQLDNINRRAAEAVKAQ
jgi:hypothetical protein